jgi:hypothetical protein
MTDVTYQTIKKLGHGAFGEVGLDTVQEQQCCVISMRM